MARLFKHFWHRLRREFRIAADRYLESPVVRAQTDSAATLAAVIAVDAMFGFPTALRLAYVFPVCIAARGAGTRWSVGIVAAAALVMTTIEWHVQGNHFSALASLALHGSLLGILLRLVARLESGLATYQTLASQDTLTGLPNRAAFERVAEKALELSRSNNQPLSIAMIDCDRFKELNDRYGHAYGDLVLKVLARSLSQTLRRYGVVARTGGDEFVAVLPGVSAALADTLLATALQRFRESGGEGTGFTFGTAEAGPGSSLASLLAEADQSMYRRKRSVPGGELQPA